MTRQTPLNVSVGALRRASGLNTGAPACQSAVVEPTGPEPEMYKQVHYMSGGRLDHLTPRTIEIAYLAKTG